MISSNYNNIKSSIYNASTNDTTKVSANKQVKEKDIDVLIDGQYNEKLRDVSLHLRGSSNQRIFRANNEDS